MELSEISAEKLIAALIKSNGGQLVLFRENVEMDYDGMVLQVSENIANGAYIFRLADAKDVEPDGTE